MTLFRFMGWELSCHKILLKLWWPSIDRDLNNSYINCDQVFIWFGPFCLYRRTPIVK